MKAKKCENKETGAKEKKCQHFYAGERSTGLRLGSQNVEGSNPRHFSYTSPNFRKPKSDIIFLN
jgi:hypothetical protein